ncbi:hypothetical protein SUNI508_10227 [Seiridium unicorne]|uniref:Uncharacterized protein n=1 Tax=Seiridium unicorne TaxID=138068 RepID=A0ABR2UMK0_9PEZI
MYFTKSISSFLVTGLLVTSTLEAVVPSIASCGSTTKNIRRRAQPKFEDFGKWSCQEGSTSGDQLSWLGGASNPMKLARASLVKSSTPIGSRCAGIVLQGEIKDEDDKDTFSHFLAHIQLDNGEMGIYVDLETKVYANKDKLKDIKSCWITYPDMFEDNTRQLLKEWILEWRYGVDG